jgi:hypothetical protein
MRLWLKIGVLLAVMCLLAAASYAELVLDIRSPRSALAVSANISSSSTYLIADINRRSQQLNQKYGDAAKTSIGAGGKLTTRVDDQVVHEETVKGALAAVTGVILVGPEKVADPSEFPFDLSFDDKLASASRGLAGSLKHHFGGALPARFLAFDDSAYTLGACFNLSTSDFGQVGQMLRFKNSRSCEISWKKTRPASMLVSLNVADGDPWMRPFSRRICRYVLSIALERVALTKQHKPDYASCILADRPDRVGAKSAIALHDYEVGAGRMLQRMGH